MQNQGVIKVRIGEVILFAPKLILCKLVNNHTIRLGDAKELIEASLKLSEGSDFVVILDGGTSLEITNEAMSYAANYSSKNWLAFAIIVRTFSDKIFAQYYIRFTKQVRPTKIFDSPSNAAKWLAQFIPINREVKYEI